MDTADHARFGAGLDQAIMSALESITISALIITRIHLMAIQYLHSVDTVTLEQLPAGFFNGWPNPPSPEAHLRILQGSYRVVLAVDTEKQIVVGFITAISDGVSAAYIPHLEVLPAYQGQGIGSELVQQMLECLNHLYMIDLVCDADLQAFYQRFEMHPYYAMIRRNYTRQSCD